MLGASTVLLLFIIPATRVLSPCPFSTPNVVALQTQAELISFRVISKPVTSYRHPSPLAQVKIHVTVTARLACVKPDQLLAFWKSFCSIMESSVILITLIYACILHRNVVVFFY